MNKDTKYAGKLTISRLTSNVRPDVIRIELRDKTSNEVMFRLETSLAAFGAAITGLSMQPCEFEICQVEHAGLKHEMSDCTLVFNQAKAPEYAENKQLRAALEPFAKAAGFPIFQTDIVGKTYTLKSSAWKRAKELVMKGNPDDNR